MLEKDFMDSIDTKFPYNDLSKGKKLIDLSISISDNSAFFIIGELVRIPKSLKDSIDKKVLHELLEYIDVNFQHSLKRPIVDIAHGILNGKGISKNEAITLMTKITQFNGLYSALNLLYFAVDDVDGEIESKYNTIIQIWNNR